MHPNVKSTSGESQTHLSCKRIQKVARYMNVNNSQDSEIKRNTAILTVEMRDTLNLEADSYHLDLHVRKK